MTGLRSLSRAITLLVVAAVMLPAQRPARVDTAALQRILAAEDARGLGAAGTQPLLDGIASVDTLLRRVSVRGIGRLERVDLARMVVPLLHDPVPAIRSAAGDAIAQSVARIARRNDPRQGDVTWAAAILAQALGAERDSAVADALAESLGRLPITDTTTARSAESAILARGGSGFGAIRGLHSLGASLPNNRSMATMARLRDAALHARAPEVRRVAMLSVAGDTAVALAASRDVDDQVRRLALSGATAIPEDLRARLVSQLLGDPSPMVRIAAINVVRNARNPVCDRIISAATSDVSDYVALIAIDALGRPCADSARAAQALLTILDQEPNRARPWQRTAHALWSLAKIDPARARAPLAAMAMSANSGVRIYAARAAREVNDVALLQRLAADRDHNVVEAAIEGLSRRAGHEADGTYIAALKSTGYQVTLAAATALQRTTNPAALPALFDAFERLTAERRENSRDPRVAVLRDIGELGTAVNADRLRPAASDFDTTIAKNAAAILSRWTGTTVAATPQPLPIAYQPLAATFLRHAVTLRVTMAPQSGGGSFSIRLFADEAPATVARTLALIKDGSRINGNYFVGHVFQRVEPNFVVQGGGPDASEYVGDAEFMRDELGPRSHLRGTLGVSSRGRDTGDAQWFFNLIDNTRLDHLYTVFGEVVEGEDVVERILEGDVVGAVVVR